MPNLILRTTLAVVCTFYLSQAVGLGVPEGGETVFLPRPTPGLPGAMRLGGAEAQLGRLEIAPASGPGFDHAYRVTVDRVADARWGVQLVGSIDQPIRAGGAYLLSFYARCIGSTTGDGSTTLKIERNEPDWSSVLVRGVSFGRAWTRFDLPFVVQPGQGLKAGQSQLTFHLGDAVQSIEIGGIELLDYADRVSIESLPRTRMTYDGIEFDAAWRSVAEQRINMIRKADLTVKVVDAAGRPVPGATVRIEQERHAFVFGTAMNLRFASSGDERVPQYLRALKERFNAVVFENELKWHGEGLRNPAAVDRGMSFVEENDLYFRGHTLVWPGSDRLPRSVNAMIERLRAEPGDENTREQLKQMVADRIASMVSRFAGRVDDWDVVNEPFTNHDLLEVLDPEGTPHGSGVMASWFQLARDHDPQARLFLNDYGILTAGDAWSAHQQHFLDTARQLIEAGAPLDGLGMQGHFAAQLTSPVRLWEILDRYAALGLPIKVTEYDLNSDDPELKADYTRDFYTAMFAHPSIDGIMAWGFWAGAHWRPQAAFLNRDFTPRPHDEVLRKLIFDQWWTNSESTTGHDGTSTTRIFKGRHEVVVEAEGYDPAAVSIELLESADPIVIPLTKSTPR